jgi:CHAD domain-containing protein
VASDDEPAGRRASVAQLLRHEIAAHAGELVQRQPDAREDRPDGVHAMRVATRRLRSVLATGRPFVDREVTDPLRDELGLLADVLGDARDAEVQAERVGQAVDDLVEERSDLDWEADHVRPALLGPLVSRRDKAVRVLRVALESERYAQLVARIDALVSAPPLTAEAEREIDDAYRRRVRHELRRLKKRMKASQDDELDPDQRQATLHGARRAVKRARYAVEAVEPVYGKRARKLARRLKKLQSQLGRLQDSVITRDYLHDLARQPDSGVDPPVALVAGAIIEREATQAEGYEKNALRAWRKVKRTGPLR